MTSQSFTWRLLASKNTLIVLLFLACGIQVVSLGKQTGFKAAAIAQDGRDWTSGVVGNYSTQQEADEAALARCQSNVESRQLSTDCRLFK